LVVALVVGVAGTAAAAAEPVAPPLLRVQPPPNRLGADVTVSITPDGTAGVSVRYGYQINSGRARSVRADGAGDASFTFTAATRTNLLTVWGEAADGERSPVVSRYVLADLVDPPAANQDLTADSVPDLVVTGTPGGLGSGLWLARGRSNGAGRGRVRVPAVNIAPDGPFGAGADNPSFDGALALTGNFFGNGYQSVLAYYPGGVNAGAAFLLNGSGDGSDLMPGVSGNEATLPSGTLSDLNGDNPLDLANAYNASGNAPVYPELIGISGDPAAGYHLEYFPEQGPGVANFNLPSQLPNLTPTGGTDWNNWRLASTLLASGTALFLWNPSTGALYLWQGLAFVDNGDFTGSLTFTPYLISASWNAGADLTAIEAADITGDGVPDLWAVDGNGMVTPSLVSNLSASGPATVTTLAPQDLR
jgi:hypothetical protein